MDVKDKIKSMEDGSCIRREELLRWIKEEHPNYAAASYSWTIYGLVRSGLITKLDNILFITGQKRNYHDTLVGPTHARILEYVSKNLSEVPMVVYESTILNEWLNHQIAKSIIFVEVNKFYADIVFEKLRNDLQLNILFNPSADEFSRYAENNTVVVQNLISQAPKQQDSTGIMIEKLIVDLFSEPALKALFSDSELAPMIEAMFQQYAINPKKMLAYAKRRKSDAKIKTFLIRFTNIKLWED